MLCLGGKDKESSQQQLCITKLLRVNFKTVLSLHTQSGSVREHELCHGAVTDEEGAVVGGACLGVALMVAIRKMCEHERDTSS